MRWHLNHIPAPANQPIRHAEGLFLIGSCFSEHMALQLRMAGFHVTDNPYGILFNPLSIANCLTQIIYPKQRDTQILERGGLFYSYDCHSSIYATSAGELISLLQKTEEEALLKLKSCHHLIITFGSAHVFELLVQKRVVANCHKQRSALFQKRLVTVDEITRIYRDLIADIKQLNPNLRMVLTVSPVKYLKDGLTDNAVSKATLLLAVHQLVSEGLAEYFPAYELVNDDLRDYRFYKEDLAHPNEQAIQYVWEKFSETYFTDNTKRIAMEVYQLKLAMNHRLMFPESEEAKLFLRDLETRCKKLLEAHPEIALHA
jgi:hypothetical protein